MVHLPTSKPAAASGVNTPFYGHEDDYIYPVHLLDGASFLRQIFTSFVKFNDVLEPQKLKDAISRLLQIGNWRKLGGRYRTKGRWLEIHVPKQYTAARPAFRFAHESCDCRFAEHRLGRQFPQAADDEVSLSAHLDESRLNGLGPNFPTSMDDLIDRDAPQLCFKIINYIDATLFTVTYPHCTWDASGTLAFMKSLQLVLDGLEDEVPPMLAASQDVLAELINRHEGYNQDSLNLNMITQKKLERALGQRPRLERRIIRVPLKILERLHSRLTDEYPREDQETWKTYRPDELLLALIIQQLARADRTPHPLTLLNVIDARLVVPSLGKTTGVYTQNLLLLAPNNLSLELTTGSMGSIASSQRDCIAQFATPDNISRFLHRFLGAIKADVDTLTITGDIEPVLINNLSRITNELVIDFSSAVVRQGEDSTTRRNAMGTADFYRTDKMNVPDMMSITTLGNFNGSECCMAGVLPARAWELLQETLDEIQ